jgi:hypothetical protein
LLNINGSGTSLIYRKVEDGQNLNSRINNTSPPPLKAQISRDRATYGEQAEISRSQVEHKCKFVDTHVLKSVAFSFWEKMKKASLLLSFLSGNSIGQLAFEFNPIALF